MGARVEILEKIIVGVVTGVIVTIISFFFGRAMGEKQGIVDGYRQAQEQYIQQVKSAPEIYVKELEKMIVATSKGKSQNLLVDARAIVSARNDMRDSLSAISKLLNSDIDHLRKEVEAAEKQVQRGEEQFLGELARTVKVIEKKWPSKKVQIEIEVRKLIAEIGFEKTLITRDKRDNANPQEGSAYLIIMMLLGVNVVILILWMYKRQKGADI